MKGGKNGVQWSVVMHCGDVFGIHPEGVVVKVKEGLAGPQWGEIFFERACLFLQVILFEIDCAVFYTNLHELFCQFISLTNWVNSGKFMDNC